MNEQYAIEKLTGLIYDYCGLNFSNNPETVQLKLNKRLKQLQIHTYSEYFNFLVNNLQEWAEVVECLTINETYFYREEKQLHVFRDVIFREFISRGEKPVKIWSAACSTGEEPYSIIMNTLDMNEDCLQQIEITATDITNSVLQTASKGTYFNKSLTFRRIPEHWINDYFECDGKYYSVSPNIKERVNFKYLNLLNFNDYPEEQSYDVIFCRNVLIYFDEETIERVVRAFYKALKKGGYLFLGHAEMISRLNIGFETVNHNGTFYYRKD